MLDQEHREVRLVPVEIQHPVYDASEALGRGSGCRGRLFELGGVIAHPFREQLRRELVLRLPVPIESGVADARLVRDVAHARAVVTVSGEAGERGLPDVRLAARPRHQAAWWRTSVASRRRADSGSCDGRI